MENKILSIVLAAFVFVCGCASEKNTSMPETLSNVAVRTSYNPDAKFPKGSKYAFVTFASDIDKGPEFALIEKRIQTAMDKQLKEKGFKPAENKGVDFFVAYTIGLQHEINVLAAQSKEKGNEWINVLVIPDDYVNGAVLVKVIDARNMEPAWLGIFNADITLKTISEEQKQQRAAYAVKELLKTFPPSMR